MAVIDESSTARPNHILTMRLLLLMAVGSGLSVASNYYVQPLLPDLADTFDASSSTVGLLVTVSQVGYVAGLALLVPLGDVLERRRLLGLVSVLTAGGLALIAAAPSLVALFPAVAAVGITSVTAQMFVALAADMADPAQRGKAVGTVMGGLFAGILLARTLAGFITGVAGWRAVYVAAALAMLTLALVSSRQLPRMTSAARPSYPALLTSVLQLYRDEPVLRRRGTYGAIGMASFAALWTSIAFLLQDTYGYKETVIGLFGLLGLAGVLAAQLAGRVADAGWARVATLGFSISLAVSWGVLAQGERSIVALIVGVVLLDLAVQGTHISNQSEVYRLRPTARSRLTTAYMCMHFSGGIIGSASSAAVYSLGGWSAVCAVGAGLSAIAIILWLTEARWPLRQMRLQGRSGRQSCPSTGSLRADP